MTAYDTWQRANWSSLPALMRQDCLDGLRADLPPRLLGLWRTQHTAGVPIGSDDRFFPLGDGQAVRNILRKYVGDGELPAIAFYLDEDGDIVATPPQPRAVPVFKSRNWDDYYLGALQELCEKP